MQELIKQAIKEHEDRFHKSKSAFVPPTTEEIKAEIRAKGYDVDPLGFWSFYEQKGWMIGKNKMKKWKIALGRCNADGWAKGKEIKQGMGRECIHCHAPATMKVGNLDFCSTECSYKWSKGDR